MGSNNNADWSWEDALKIAAHLGLKPWEFLEFTPAELNLYVEVYQENKKNDYNNLMAAAYLGAALTRTKKMPRFNEIIKNTEKKSSRMTPEEMYEKVKILNTAFGGNSKNIGDG